MTTPDGYVSPASAANLKGVSTQAVRDILQNAERRAAIFPGAYMVGEGKGGMWFIPRAEAEAWQPRKYPRKNQ